MQLHRLSSVAPGLLLGLLLGLSLGSIASAQVTPRALIISLDPLDGAPGRQANGIERIAPSHAGGMVALVTTVDVNGGSNLLYDFWGSLGDTSFTRLETSDPAGPLAITRFEGIPGAAEGRTAAQVETNSGAAIVVDGQVVVREGETTAPGGAQWFSFDGVHLDSTGQAWYRGRYTGAASGIGFFRGTTPIFVSGDSIPGMTGTVNPAGAPFLGYDISRDGDHWMAVLRSNTTFRNHVVRNGAVLAAGGVPLITGNTLPAPFQASPNETYNSFGLVQIASNDRWAVIGGTPSAFIIRDGDMYRRTGDVVDGRVLANGFRGIALDDTGAIAWIGRLDLGGSQDPYALFYEDDFLFAEGDTIDVDGDGVADPGFTVRSIEGDRGRLALGEDGAVYSIVRLDTPGGLRFALLVTDPTLARPYCSSSPNASGRHARLQTRGSVAAADQDVTLACLDMPANTFALFLASRDAGFVPNVGGSLGDLCLGGTLGRFNSLIQNSGAARIAEAAIDITAIPEGGVASTAMAGETWRFQCWFRDIAGGLPASNFSDAVALTFR